MLAPISWRTPPRHYGPWELVTSLITEGLVAAGIDVTLFATQDSLTKARLAGSCPRPLSEDATLDGKVWEYLHISTVFERAAEFDLIHNQLDFMPLAFSKLVTTPVLTTIHGFSSQRIVPMYKKYADNSYYVSISDADRHPELPYLATIHHGIDIAGFTFHETPRAHLVFFGRIHPDKGVAEAIAVAHAVERPLIIAGIIHDETYFATKVKPHLDDQNITYIGPVGPAERDNILGSAYALLHLVNFAEPFGLSMIEAMACGTPVIAKPLGSVPEIVRDGVNGYIVSSTAAAIRAVGAIDQLSRTAIRAYAKEHFSVERMVQQYLAVYQQILSRT